MMLVNSGKYLWGIGLTLWAFALGTRLKEKVPNPLFNPTLFAITAIILFLSGLKIDYDAYNMGGSLIGFFLGPATIALAVPIYKQRKKLRENFSAILLSIAIGSLMGIVSGMAVAALWGASPEVVLSMAPKSVTTPIALEISENIGGIPSLTVAMVIIAGVFGATAGPEILNRMGIKNPLARGLGIGTASHGLGTSRAVQEGEVEGAFSGLAMGIAGIITALLIPLLLLPFFR